MCNKQIQWLCLVLNLPEDQLQTRKMKFAARILEIWAPPIWGWSIEVKRTVTIVQAKRDKKGKNQLFETAIKQPQVVTQTQPSTKRLPKTLNEEVPADFGHWFSWTVPILLVAKLARLKKGSQNQPMIFILFFRMK
jgi:hypothetical protein